MDLSGIIDISGMHADMPTTEFRTKNGALSTWYIESIDGSEDAFMAIALTSDKIEEMDFIIMDTKLLGENGLSFKQTPAGREVGIAELQDTHFDIVNVTVDKLKACTALYHKIVQQDPTCKQFIRTFAEGEFKDAFRKAISTKRLDISKQHSKAVRNYLKDLGI